MKRLRKIVRTLFVFFIVINQAVYAETEILSGDKFDIKKTVTLGAGIFLVVQILFISYKLDKEPKKRIATRSKKKENMITEDLKTQKEDKNLFVKLELEKTIETLSNDEIKKQELQNEEKSKKKVKEMNSKSKKKDLVSKKEDKEPKKRDIKEIEETRKKITRMVGEARKGAMKVTEETKKSAVETTTQRKKGIEKITEESNKKMEKNRSKAKKKLDKK